MNNEGLENSDIIQRYVSICNVALFKNAQRFPFKQILKAAENTSYGRIIEVEISDWPEAGKFAFQLHQGRIVADKHECGRDCKCDGKWSVSRNYLESVITYAPVFIENPARIDWDWLYIR